MGKILSISSSGGGGIEPEKKALLIDGPSINSIIESKNRSIERIIIQNTPFIEDSDNEITLHEDKISTIESDYDIMLYVVENYQHGDTVYIAPTKEIITKKIYVNNDASRMFYIYPHTLTSIQGLHYLDFSLPYLIDEFIDNTQTLSANIIGDAYFNFKNIKRLHNFLASSPSGNLKIILPNTLEKASIIHIFTNMQLNGSIVIVDMDAEKLHQAVESNMVLYKCIGTAIFIDYTAGHEDAAQALVDLIGGYNNQYNGQVLLGQEVTI